MYEEIGFVGYSNHALRIAKSFINLNKNFSFIFFNYKKEKNKQIKSHFKFSFVEQLERIKKCKIIIICSPPNTHYYYLKKLINRNSYIFLEKPPVVKNSELKSINEIKYKKNIYFNFNYVFSDLFFFLEKVLKKKSYGKLINFKIHISHGLAYKNKKNKKNNWRFKKDNLNSIAGNLGIHYIHLLIKIFGKPNFNKINNFAFSNNNIIDTAYLNLNFDKFFAEIFLSYASVKYKKIELIFTNCILIITEEKVIEHYPRDTFDNKGLFKTPKLKILHQNNLLSNDGLDLSVKYFYNIYKKSKKFKVKHFNQAIYANKILLEKK